jgi:serine/threonine protein kinase
MPEQKNIGEYFQVISELNSGGFGQTFLAEDLRIPNKPKCVIKQLKPQSNDPKIIELASRLFEQEVAALYQLGKHPQIPTLITHFEENAEFYFVQEYIEGNTFEQELRLGKVYNQTKVIEIISQLLDVLSFVHQHNVIHRDIKPANLINRTSDGKIVLIDFGAVKQVKNQTVVYPNQALQNTIAIGSDGFMPPEQLAGQPKFSSDVYAVGMFAVQLLTQTHPTQLRQNQRTGEWIWQDKTNVNPRFAEVINQMIRYDFRQRFANAIDANNALKRLNLNGKNQSVEVWKQNNTTDFNQTQATFSTPVPAFQPSQNHTQQRQYPPTTIEPQNNYQQQFKLQNSQQTSIKSPQFGQIQAPQKSLLEQYAGNKPNKMPLPVSDENISLSSFSFSDLKESTAFTYFVRLLIGVGVFILLIKLLFAVKVNSAQEGVYTMPQETKNFVSKDHMKSAIEAEKYAVTSEDWQRVANGWQAAIVNYEVVEAVSNDETEKNNAKHKQAVCLDRKITALKRSDNLRTK